MVAAIERTRRRRRTVRDLMALDDHTLRDIGLHRSEVLYTVWSRDEARRHRS